MSSSDIFTTFSVSLALEAHTQAEYFRQKHSNRDKARQVYLNTLAVYAVNFYLNCLEVETDLLHSSSWKPAHQSLLNTADLLVKQCGVLECRPVLPEAQTLHVPPEVQHDRIGYVAVQMDQALKRATLLGFIPTANTETIPLEQLQPLDKLVEHIEQQIAPVRTIRLTQWLQTLVDDGWQTVENLFIPQQPTFAFRNNSINPPPEAIPELAIQRYKQMQLSPESEAASIDIGVAIGLLPLLDNEMDILVQVSPTESQNYLPPNLRLLVLDALGTEVMQAEARSTKAIRLRFTGTIGEQFSLQIALGSTSVIESFII